MANAVSKLALAALVSWRLWLRLLSPTEKLAAVADFFALKPGERGPYKRICVSG